MNNYIIKNTDVIFPSGRKITFNYQINEEILEYDGILILTLSVPSQGDWLFDNQSEDYNRNVFGIDVKNEKILWQIEKHPKLFGAYSVPRKGHLDNDVFLWGHPNIEINPYNGKLIKIIPSKSQWD